MFTGLVRAIGRLEHCSGGVRVSPPEAGRFDHASREALGSLALGDSVAVDGVCLTVAELYGAEGASGFRADVSGETLRRSNLWQRASARGLVNLEPALRLMDRLGGHLVSGHVDGLGTVLDLHRSGPSWWLEIAWQEPRFGRYVCEKASVAVDGISLTVADCDADGVRFRMAVIPHTWTATTLAQRKVGDAVNLEADLLAKYSERLLRAQGHGMGTSAAAWPGERMPESEDGAITPTWLAERGW